MSIVKYYSICQRGLYGAGSTEYLRLAHRSGNQNDDAGTPMRSMQNCGPSSYARTTEEAITPLLRGQERVRNKTRSTSLEEMGITLGVRR
jgi:hypothetical protein